MCLSFHIFQFKFNSLYLMDFFPWFSLQITLLLYLFVLLPIFQMSLLLTVTQPNTRQRRNHLEIIFLQPGATVMGPPTETNRGNYRKHVAFWIQESKETYRNDFSMSPIVIWSHTEHIGAEIKANSMSDLPLVCIVTQSHSAGVYNWNILQLSTHKNKQETSRILYLQKCSVLHAYR